ncbi:hypothetical protein ABV508_002057 [Salmonella enterica]|nr:hypothetical protein [Salmonella enterica subsp. arizonae]EEF7980014.1 hypothetical protein [Salmonella enterica subsp. arizonae serovar 40:z4,z32:-]EEO9711766.1 hypothetical protein [Salmonella enterica]EDX5492656.1 hypothetical protein [Salmonella enterica subsp. arizonae]EHW9404899.1 hypothetical protein [Salmonella enterica]
MNNKDNFLPTRDFLRQLIGQNYVKPSELKNILRARGVFCSSDDKKLLGGIIIKTGISAEEYLLLKETYKSKEDNPKISTRQIQWQSDISLFNALEHDFDFQSLIDDDFGNVRLVRSPFFVMTDPANPNSVRLDVMIERRDITKNWGDDISYHKGYVEFNKEDNTSHVQMTLCYSSKEIKNFVNNLTKKVIKKFKEDGYVGAKEDVLLIRFHDFDNTGRVNFFYELSNNWRNDNLYFSDTKDLQFSPDKIDDKTPENLKWMKDTIDDLKIKGKGIHSTFFFSNKLCHKYLKLYKISCDYNFYHNDIEGTCRVNYEFPDIESRNSELSVDIGNFNLSKNDSNLNKDVIKTRLLRILDEKKVELYKKYKIRTTSENLVVS